MAVGVAVPGLRRLGVQLDALRTVRPVGLLLSLLSRRQVSPTICFVN